MSTLSIALLSLSAPASSATAPFPRPLEPEPNGLWARLNVRSPMLMPSALNMDSPPSAEIELPSIRSCSMVALAAMIGPSSFAPAARSEVS